MTKEGSYLRGQESSNGFKFSNSCIVEWFWSICKKDEDLMFLKHCDNLDNLLPSNLVQVAAL